MLGRMEGVNTNPKDGPAARYGYRASIAGSAAARPLRRACALWWVLVRCKGMHCRSGSAHGPSGAQGPFGIPPGHPRRWFGFGAFLALFFLAHRGGDLRKRAKTVISDTQGGTRGVWGLKGAVQGPPVDPSDGPIASLIERDT